MSLTHKLAIYTSNFVFRSALFFGLTFLAAYIVFGSPNTIKQALIQANAYERYSQAIVDSGKEQTKNDPNSIPFEDPAIEAIVKKSLNEKSLKSISETGVDSIYQWLRGDTEQVEFAIDVSDNKEILAKGISDYAIERLLLLVPCTEIPSTTNVFRVECYPPDVDINSLRSDIYASIINDDSIFKADTLKPEDLPNDENGTPLLTVYERAPDYYRWLFWAPWILLSLSLFGAIGMVYSSRSKRRGLQSVAKTLIGTGVILAIAPIIYVFILPSINFGLPGTNSSNESISSISNDVMKFMYSSFNTMLINIAIQILVVGLIVLVFSKYFMKRRSPYEGVNKRVGIVSSIDNQNNNSSKIYSTDIPVQTSEAKTKQKHKMSKIEKKFRKL